MSDLSSARRSAISDFSSVRRSVTASLRSDFVASRAVSISPNPSTSASACRSSKPASLRRRTNLWVSMLSDGHAGTSAISAFSFI